MSGGTGDLTGNYLGCLYRRAGRYEFLENDRESSLYVPIAGIDPCSLPRVVIDEVHLPVEVLGDVPPFRKRYLPIPSPWHISLRSKSIQNLSLYRRRAVDGRISVRAGARFSGRIYGTLARRPRRERTGENETGRRRGTAEEERERTGDPAAEEQVDGGRGGGRGSSETANGGGSAGTTRTAIKRIVHTRTHIPAAHRRNGETRSVHSHMCTRACAPSFSFSSFSLLSHSFSLARAHYSAIMNTSLS